MKEAVELWKAKKAADGENADPVSPVISPPIGDGNEKPFPDSPAPVKSAGSGVEEKLATVKDHRDRRDADGVPGDMDAAKSVIAQQDEDLDTLTACLEALLADQAAKKDGMDCEKQDCDKNQDCGDVDCKDEADNQSQSMNADAADEIIRQRLSICRIGDKLRMDGLEDKSIIDGKKAIIAKVLPNIRLDGKSKAYIDACYDLAVGKVNERKDADYQRRQMAGGRVQTDSRTDNNISMASAARQRMLDREGGNE